jgi:tetratricopeptide (TPR) repeat protein
VLILVGAGVYANSLSGPFIFDDYPAILNNGDIRELWPLWRSSETSDRPSINSRPLVRLSLAGNYMLGGLRVGGYRIFNIAVHIACALVGYALMRRALAGRGLETARGLALVGALLWLVHPLNSQVVNYITQRSESLMALCYLAMLYCIERRGVSGRAAWSLGAVACCYLGMASKEVMVTAPVVALAYDRATRAGSPIAAVRTRPWLYAGLASSWVLLAVLIASSPHGTSVGFGQGISSYQYLLNQSVIVVGYLSKILWPTPLLLDYGLPQSLTLAEVVPQTALLLMLVGGALWAARRYPLPGFCAAFFFVALAPTSSFVPIVNEVGADRRVYLPLMALCALLVAGGWWRIGAQLRGVAGGLVLFAIAALALFTLERNQVYRSAVDLWRAEVAVLPGNYRGHNNLGLALVQAGDAEAAVPHFQRALALEEGFPEAYNNLGLALEKLGLVEGAVNHYRQALAQSPEYALAHNNLGSALVAAGDRAGAQWHYRQALELDPGLASAHNNLGLLSIEVGDAANAEAHYRRALAADSGFGQAHVNLALLLEESGRLQEALEHYRRASEVAPDLVAAHYNLGTVLEEIGQLDAAGAAYDRALMVDPELHEAHYRLGLLAGAQGRWREARVNLRRTIALAPDHAAAHFHLGRLLVQADSFSEGLAHYRRAVALEPELVEGHYNLGTALLQQGQATEALIHFRRAVGLEPGFAEGHNNLGIALQLVGRSDEAVAEFRQALQIRPDYAEARANLDAARRRKGAAP